MRHKVFLNNLCYDFSIKYKLKYKKEQQELCSEMDKVQKIRKICKSVTVSTYKKTRFMAK